MADNEAGGGRSGANRLAKPGDGWRVANALLGHERGMHEGDAEERRSHPWEDDLDGGDDSFGGWLRQQREIRGISLREIADASKISIRYLEALEQISGRLGISDSDTLAVGDGANDLGMIGRAGLGVAVHAKPVVAASAPAQINHGDLTALLYLQGYARAEFSDV